MFGWLNPEPITVVDLMLNDLGGPAGEGLDTDSKSLVLPVDLNGTVTSAGGAGRPAKTDSLPGHRRGQRFLEFSGRT